MATGRANHVKDQIAAALAAMLLCALAAPAGRGAEPSPAVRRLAEYKLEPTTESLGRYLTSLHPTPEREHELRGLIAQLDDADFARRESAMRELTRQVDGLAPLLDEAIRGENPEIRWRAKVIRDQTDRESRSLLTAVLNVVYEQKVAGLAEPLIRVLPLCLDEPTRQLMRRALAASATPADAGFLRQQLAAASDQARIAALGALAAVLGQDADDGALPLLDDPSEEVQLAAARELANHGRREALPVLVRLLDSSATAIRTRAFQTLRALTGQHFNYTVYAPPEQRAAALAAWQAWLTKDGSAATLSIPLVDAPVLLGRLLVCDHAQGLLVEFDATGKTIWEKAVGPQPWACSALASGHRLVGLYQEKAIVEYSAAGEEVWRVDGLPGGPTSVHRLESGNTLAACTEGQIVVEIDPAKQIVWRASLEGRPVDARRLGDGHTLITLQNSQKVVEVDSAGKVVWEISGVGQAFSAERLENGNTLVSAIGHNKVREFDRAGRVVWERGAFANPYTAQRLASGNTLVVDTSGVTEIDPQGNTVHKLARANLSRAWKY
jgi:hypothetical protein